VASIDVSLLRVLSASGGLVSVEQFKEIVAGCLIQYINLDDAQQTSALPIREAATKQTKGAWKKVLGILQGVKSGALAIKDTVTDVDELVHMVGELAG
jgi:hypothetical protein